MNIPDEAARRYPEDYKTIGGNAGSRRDFTAGAQWARKEALREALAAVSTPSGNCLPIAAIQALAEGDNQ